MFLHLIYTLEYEKLGDYCEKIIKFKENIDWEKIKSNPSTKKNEEVYDYYKNFRKINCPELFHPTVNIYFTELNDDLNIKLLYFEFENLELITPEYINSIYTFSSLIHRHIKIMNYIYIEDLPEFQYKIDKILQDELTKPRFYKVDVLPISQFIKTKIYSHQYDNIHWMLNKESNLTDSIITSKIYKFNDDRIYRYEQNDFHTEETLPRLKIKGGVITDEVGSGKSLQFICLTLSNPDLYNVILVPDHLKNQWVNEYKKHLNIPMPSNVRILTFTEYKDYNGLADRLLVDELHELYSNPENNEVFKKAINDSATFKWVLTATPFPNINNSISNILKFLTSTNFPQEQLQKYVYNFETIKEIFKKNDINMIKYEVILPEIEFINELISFSPKEKIVYDAECEAGSSTNVNTLRKICCDVLLSLTNQEVSVNYKNFTTLVKENYHSKYEDELEKLNELGRMIVNAKKVYDELKIENLFENIKHLENKYKEQNIIVINKKKSLDFIMEHFGDIPTCSYCLGDIDKENNCSIIKTCNHYFCSECMDIMILETQLKGGIKCPLCKNNFTRNDVISVDKNYTVEKYPSKIIRLIEIIKGLDEKIIIYTQFDALIQKLKIIFDSENIPSIIFTSDSDVETMKTSDNKVMILSSNKNASGLDLSFIKKILIFEPFIGSQAHLRDVEKQIIGRIYRNGQTQKCNVFRLIIKDTIEEQIYNESL